MFDLCSAESFEFNAGCELSFSCLQDLEYSYPPRVCLGFHGLCSSESSFLVSECFVLLSKAGGICACPEVTGIYSRPPDSQLVLASAAHIRHLCYLCKAGLKRLRRLLFFCKSKLLGLTKVAP